MASKHYFLFGIRVWSVVVEMPEAAEVEEIEEIEDEPDGTNTQIAGSSTLSADDKPQFGFTPWSTNDTAAWLWEEE